MFILGLGKSSLTDFLTQSALVFFRSLSCGSSSADGVCSAVIRSD